jgi:general secretion pathway protein D
MKKLLLILLALVLASCAGQESLRQGQEMIEAGNEEAGLARLEEAMKANPNDAEIRNYYLRHRAVAVQRYLQLGDNARAAGAFDQAEASYQRALRFDPANANAKAGLEALVKERQSRQLLAEADEALKKGDAEAAAAKAKAVLATRRCAPCSS